MLYDRLKAFLFTLYYYLHLLLLHWNKWVFDPRPKQRDLYARRIVVLGDDHAFGFGDWSGPGVPTGIAHKITLATFREPTLRQRWRLQRVFENPKTSGADIYVIALGSNDARYTSLTPAETLANLQSICDYILEKCTASVDPTIYVLSIPTAGDQELLTPEKQSDNRHRNELMAQWLEGETAQQPGPNIRAGPRIDLSNYDYERRNIYWYDQRHFNKRGYTQITKDLILIMRGDMVKREFAIFTRQLDCPLCKTPATFVIYDVDEAASTFKRLYFDQGSFNYERSVVRAEEVRRQRQRDRRRHKSRRRIPAAPSSKPVNMDLPASLQGPFVYIDPTCHMPIPRPSSQLPYDPSSPTSKILYRQNVYTNDLTSTPLPISPYYRHVDYLMPNHLPRAIPFIQRDLQALLRDDYDDMILHHVQEAFLIPYHQHLQHPTQAIIRALAGWFGEEDQTSPKITSRFVSEVLDFVKSGLSMAQYDQQKNTVDRESERESGESLVAYAKQHYAQLTIKQQRERLPIFKSRTALLYLVEKYQTVIVVGQTGCGKTTQLPQYLEEAGWAAGGRMIACTQPRRVAATTVAQRVAEEKGTQLGREVGYTIRFEDVSSDKTAIKYMTDGMLFRETMMDPLLSKYSVIMVDEAHERTLYTDILIGILKKIQRKRPELRLIISSATLDAESFYGFFNHNTTDDPSKDTVSIISLEGRMYPVDILYTNEPVPDYVESTIQTVFDIHTKEAEGDILVFMTGRDEIDTVVQEIYTRAVTLPAKSPKILALPIYAGLPADQQMEIFDTTPANTRKVVVATNIAEASITIEGIAYVVDCGFVKLRAYNPMIGMESLTTTPISKASAIQRAGRAGRVRSGKAFRLYTEESYTQLRDASIPEIQRSNLATLILQLKALGIDNVLRFNFLTAPPAQMMARALEFLYSLKALDEYGRLTIPMGMRLAEFPLDPMLAKILLDSPRFGCTDEMLTIAAMVSVQNVFVDPSRASKETVDHMRRKFYAQEGDHLTLLNVYTAFVTKGQKSAKWCSQHYLNFKNLSRAMGIRSQLSGYLRRFGIQVTKSSKRASSEQIRKCLASGYFAQAAKAMEDGSGRFRTLRDGVILHTHPSSVLFTRNPQCVIFHEVVETTKNFMRDLTVVEPAWLAEEAPHFYQMERKMPPL
ncbi:hypothetical protein BZG36_01812 [Bifiguratus adelaidae]|uniref:RNA helicase n=1 Tax=Bifiguratus adelaidae TaxID=1938954 RepID=A0A261Y298_9FUNG|nr:hypothetical protein BZG36_01812 [Bifiguratus adelaidae]